MERPMTMVVGKSVQPRKIAQPDGDGQEEHQEEHPPLLSQGTPEARTGQRAETETKDGDRHQQGLGGSPEPQLAEDGWDARYGGVLVEGDEDQSGKRKDESGPGDERQAHGCVCIAAPKEYRKNLSFGGDPAPFSHSSRETTPF